MEAEWQRKGGEWRSLRESDGGNEKQEETTLETGHEGGLGMEKGNRRRRWR